MFGLFPGISILEIPTCQSIRETIAIAIWNYAQCSKAFRYSSHFHWSNMGNSSYRNWLFPSLKRLESWARPGIMSPDCGMIYIYIYTCIKNYIILYYTSIHRGWWRLARLARLLAGWLDHPGWHPVPQQVMMLGKVVCCHRKDRLVGITTS